jgi:mercuric ion transport protein
MKPKRTFVIGSGGTIILGICCFTPVLVIALGAVGLSAWLAWLDYLLLPLFFCFIGITVFGVWLMVRSHRETDRMEKSA